MKKNLSLLALTGTLALGTFVGFELSERTSAQVTGSLPTTSAPVTSGTASTTDTARARTQSETNTVQVVKARQDGVVYIEVTDRGGDSSPQAQLRRDLQERFGFELPQQGPQESAGSGFFVNAQGDILTNNHVVEGADEITIRLHGSNQTYTAKVVGRAPDFDLALIRAEGLPREAIRPIPLGQMEGLEVGLKAIALGAPFGLDFSVSEGIISSLERTVPVGAKGVEQNVIQTDAAINPGNSGGPLLDSAGQVIGVNTQILTGGIGQSAGVGFAVPVDTVRRLLPQLQRGGEVQTPTLGLGFRDVASFTAEEREQAGLPEQGAVVLQVYPGSPAERAGLRGSSASAVQGGDPVLDGDVIVAVDGQPLEDAADLPRAVIGKQIGNTLRLTVERGGQQREVTVPLQAFALPESGE
ncbi:S1-C subfamily serine protease [Deinococcus sp. HSC-46F16]|uniref:S1C family serine protease n=1 Tax=Deinococcus sp. HSC-46F16 TaxID=2910968 RepID=UPI00209C7D88|nr:trypsin-like peptidase domain-containing protein [Deinococcus sp. HSC-46F16]MCP2013562.1 S1-C subfamily serine protease [Deinococcus sp. HSC-46F16]